MKNTPCLTRTLTEMCWNKNYWESVLVPNAELTSRTAGYSLKPYKSLGFANKTQRETPEDRRKPYKKALENPTKPYDTDLQNLAKEEDTHTHKTQKTKKTNHSSCSYASCLGASHWLVSRSCPRPAPTVGCPSSRRWVKKMPPVGPWGPGRWMGLYIVPFTKPRFVFLKVAFFDWNSILAAPVKAVSWRKMRGIETVAYSVT